MKITTIRNVPATTREVVIATVCDLCSRKEKGDGWETSLFGIEDVEISYESGDRYPEGGSSEVISYDICPKCFKNKLMPWLESQGAKHKKKERDW